MLEPTSASAVARRYHLAWSTRHFEEAIALLDENLSVETPVNHYPTVASFARALAAFGSLVEGVTLLAEFGGVDEAMLLYDMRVSGLGEIRVAEHFTLKSGRIVRLRQVHDTVAIRAAGFAS